MPLYATEERVLQDETPPEATLLMDINFLDPIGIRVERNQPWRMGISGLVDLLLLTCIPLPVRMGQMGLGRERSNVEQRTQWGSEHDLGVFSPLGL